LRCVVKPGRTAFKVTPKEGIDLGGLGAIRQLRAVTVVAILLSTGLVLRVLDETTVNLLPDLPGIAVLVVPVIALFELRRVLRTLALVARRRQFRTEYRMALDAPVALSVSGNPVPVIGQSRDISPSGLRLALPHGLDPGRTATATLTIPTVSGTAQPIRLELQVQSCRSEGASWTVGTQITDADPQHRRLLIEYCYVVSTGMRLRGEEPLPLPAPAELGVFSTRTPVDIRPAETGFANSG
jgi:hypothetical protein